MYPSRKKPTLSSYFITQKAKHNAIRYRKTPIKRPKALEKTAFITEEQIETNFTPRLKLNITEEAARTPIAPEIMLNTFRVKSSKIRKIRPDYKVCLKESINELQSLNLKTEAKISEIIGKKPYSRKNSREFMLEIKENNLKQVTYMLEKDPYLVYTYDRLGMTPLHWCALRNYRELASLLIQFGASVNNLDFRHRTPLFIASSYGNYEVTKLLLINNADSLKVGPNKHLPVSKSQDLKIKKMLKKNMIIESIRKMQKKNTLTTSMINDNLK